MRPAWSQWEGATLLPAARMRSGLTNWGTERFALAFARIECHYFVKRVSGEENQLLAEAHRLKTTPRRHHPGPLRRGAPPMTAWELHKAWPEAEFVLVPDAGHTATEPGITDALVRATDRFRHAENA